MFDASILDWLLEEDNPSVRYLTLTRLLKRPSDDPEVQSTWQRIQTHGLVPAILAKQSPEGLWGEAKLFYRDKYHGTVWALLILAELGADPDHPQIRQACEFILEHAQDPEFGGFSYDYSPELDGGLPSGVVPCLTGNLVFTLIRLGYLHDPRVQKALRWITTYQRTDDGETHAPATPPYERYRMCWGKHSCHMGVAKAMKALAEIPTEERSDEVKATLERLSGYFLNHHLYKKSHDLATVARPGWLKPGFPLMYQTDILELLGLFHRLGIEDPRLNEAREVLRRKQREDGRWILENSFNGRTIVPVETKGKPSKWITLKALEVLSPLDGSIQERIKC